MKQEKQGAESKEAQTKTQTEPEKKTPEKAAAQAGKPETDSSEELKKQAAGLQEKLKKAEDSLAQQKDAFLRTAAEYDNYRKRTSREKQAAYADATADAVKEFLGVEDNLERALEQKDCSAEDLRKGVEMTQKQLQAALKKLGVTEMGKEGDPFDPALHSAVAHVEDKSLGENVIAKVFQKGYQIDGKVVRHAMVQTAN